MPQFSRFPAVPELDEGFCPAHYFQGRTYSETDQHEEAIRELEREAKSYVSPVA
jgi:hypothetical protein